MQTFTNDYHASYPDIYRYWSPESQKYAGCDNLLSAINRGWEMDDTVYYEEFWLAGMRPVVVYHFDFTRRGVHITMPVMNNPFVRRVLRRPGIELLPIAERAARARQKGSE